MFSWNETVADSEVLQGEIAFSILKVKVYKIKDFHYKIVHEAVQVLVQLLPLLDLSYSYILSYSSD